MALTLAAEQRMARVSLIQFYGRDANIWIEAAQEAHDFVKNNFPAGSIIRRDDVSKALVPVLEVNETLRDKINESKLRQKFWITFFADLIIDRAWDDLQGDEDD